MSKVIVGMALNVELSTGAKYDRFQPNVSIEIDTNSEKSVDEQISDGVIILEKSWKKLSDTLEGLVNEELSRNVKWGD